MKNKKKLITSLFGIIGLIIVVVGIVVGVVYDHSNIVALAALLICLGAIFLLMWWCRMLSDNSADKEKKKAKQQNYFKRLNEIDEKRQAFKFNADYPEPNTVKLVGAGIEFYAEGRYVCEKDHNHVSGHHLAFEISSTSLKHMPEDYDDVCDIESTGVLVSVGYIDGEALGGSAKVNGVLLSRAPENYGDFVITLDSDGDDCTANVWTAECDEIDYGFVKILNCEDDIITIYFSLTVSYGLCDTVEGVVELKKEKGQTSAIQSVINKVKRKRYNTIEVSADEVKAIKQANPFLPESYITFLKEVGFADMDWIDIGHNEKTPTNLADDEIDDVTALLAEHYSDKALDDFYFIGIDCDGRYYAFSKNGDGKVYEFSDDGRFVEPYDSFEKLLTEIITA